MSEPCNKARFHPALRAARKDSVREDLKRLGYAVEPLVLEDPVHERAVDEPRVREEVSRAPASVADARPEETKPSMYSRLISGAEPGRTDEGDGANPSRGGGGERKGDRAPEGVADEMCGLHLGRVHEVDHRVGEARTEGSGIGAGLGAVAREVEGDHP